MDLWTTMQAILRETPWLNAPQIHERAPELNRKTLLVQLGYRVRKGHLVRRGAKRKYEYALQPIEVE